MKSHGTPIAIALLALVGSLTLPRAAVLDPGSTGDERIPLPPSGEIGVAFVLTDGATVIDFAGPWEVFQDVMLDDKGEMRQPFRLYTVGATLDPLRASGGMRIVPDFTFDTAPAPDVVVVPAQRGAPGLTEWLRRVRPHAAVVMSVCTGAFKLAEAGLLDGKKATTHHDFFDRFESRFPSVSLQRGTRFVRADAAVYTAGGLTSGIDLALHVVERYFGREMATRTAAYMEYEGTGWKR